MIADEPGEPGWPPRHIAAGMDVGHNLFGRARQGLPTGMDGGEEIEIILAVHGLARRWAEIVGREDAVAAVAHRREQRLRARRDLGVGDDRAAPDEGLGLMTRVRR